MEVSICHAMAVFPSGDSCMASFIPARMSAAKQGPHKVTGSLQVEQLTEYLHDDLAKLWASDACTTIQNQQDLELGSFGKLATYVHDQPSL